MHAHWCELVGHRWECGDGCHCVCGHPMEGYDHSTCPIELRPCPEHQAEYDQLMAEALAGLTVTTDGRVEPEMGIPHCECGCANADSNKIVGWCMWCDHVYADCSPEFEDDHFANHCPEAPIELKEEVVLKRGVNKGVSQLASNQKGARQ